MAGFLLALWAANPGLHPSLQAALLIMKHRLRTRCANSCLMQDEPEQGAGFSYKMSLEAKTGMLGIDHHHGRYRRDEPGADPVVFSGQRRGGFRGTAAGRSVRVGGGDVGAASVRQPEPRRQGTGAALPKPDDGFKSGASDAVDCRTSSDGAGDSGAVSTYPVRHAVHLGRCATAGLRRQGARELERAGDQANHRAGTQRVWADRLPEPGKDLGGAPVPAAELDCLPEGQPELSTDPAHADSHRRAAQAAAARVSGIPAHRYGAPGRSGGPQGSVSHQRGGSSDAVGDRGRDAANLRILAPAGTRSHAGAVSLRDPRLSFRQRQRVHQLQRCSSAGQVADRTDQVTSAPFRRQRPGRNQERSHHSQAYRLRLHRCKTCRRDGSIPPSTSEPLCQLPSTLRRAENRHRGQWEAQASLSTVGHTVRVVSAISPLREPAETGRHTERTTEFCADSIRHRGRACHAARQTPTHASHRQAQRLKSPSVHGPKARSAVEMTGGGHLWKTGIANAMGTSRRFPTAAHHPWKTLRVSHIPTAPTTLFFSFSLFKSRTKGPDAARCPYLGSGSSFNENMLSAP